MRRYYVVILSLAAMILACEPAARPDSQSQAALTSLRVSTTAKATQSAWARDRITALSGIWGISPEGQAGRESYALRQMPGQPGWFGSHGFLGWAGAGQARPSSVLHEMMHSYWGAFSITGIPSLSWQPGMGEDVAPAMRMYRKDLATFMRQPPDRYEALRERLRNFPNLSKGDYPDLYHFGEADLVQAVGGDLNLVPPILRKYYDRFLQPGPFETWHDAIVWYLGLPPEQRGYADLLIGMSNIPMGPYQGLRPKEPTSVPPSIPAIAKAEERQRLRDFVEQYDLIKQNQFNLVDAAQVDRGFFFWRGYLQEAKDLYRKNPEVLQTQTGTGGQRLAALFDTYIAAEEMPRDKQVDYLKRKFAEDGELLDFSATLPTHMLIDLFADTPSPGDASSAQAVTRLFTGKLIRYTQETEAILAIARKDPDAGSKALQDYFAGMSDETLGGDMGLVFDLMRGADVALTKKITNKMSDHAVLRLVYRNAGVARNDNVTPERLAAALHIQPDTPTQELVDGIRVVMSVTSGNFEIDAPTTDIFYKVIAEVGEKDPMRGLTVLEKGGMPLLPFVRKHPKLADRMFAAAPERFAGLVASAGKDDYGNTPWRIIHGMIAVKPELAASVVGVLDRQGKTDIATESVIVFAFDAERTATIPGIPLSLANDGHFLDGLALARGEEWLTRTMARAVGKYSDDVQDGAIDPAFIQEYRRTLRAALDRTQGEARERLERVFREAFAEAGEHW